MDQKAIVDLIEKRFGYDIMANRDLFVVISSEKGILFSGNSKQELLSKKKIFDMNGLFLGKNDFIFCIERYSEEIRNNNKYKA